MIEFCLLREVKITTIEHNWSSATPRLVRPVYRVLSFVTLISHCHFSSLIASHDFCQTHPGQEGGIRVCEYNTKTHPTSLLALASNSPFLASFFVAKLSKWRAGPKPPSHQCKAGQERLVLLVKDANNNKTVVQ